MKTLLKIAIIGVNSPLGLALVQRLKKSHVLKGVYNSNTNNLDADIENVPVEDFLDSQDNFDVIFFLSAYIPSQQETDHKKLFDVNVYLMSFCLDKFPEAKFIFASSVSVYGHIKEITNELSPSINASAYGLSKLWAEHLLLKHHSYAILRISSMYGPGMKQTTFLPYLIKQALTTGVITLYGKGERLQNYIHINDVADAFCAAYEITTNGIFLAVSDRSYSNKEVAELVAEQIPGTKITYQSHDNSFSSVFNNQYTCSTMNWKNKINLRNGIKELIEWTKKEYS